MKQLSVIALITLAVVQFFVPAKMIADHEHILKNGKEYKFKTAPIDPGDPFRGRYINLYFQENEFPVKSDTDFLYNEPVFVELSTDSAGYAIIKSISRQLPKGDADYVKAKVSYLSNNGTNDYVVIDYPFTIFYMEETKAPEAEQAYTAAMLDSNQVSYAQVKILNGAAVIQDVLINGISVTNLNTGNK